MPMISVARRIGRRRGVVLLLVVIAVAGLIAVVGQLEFSSAVGSARARAFFRRSRDTLLVRAGSRVSQAVLETDALSTETDDLREPWAGEPFVVELPVGRLTIALYDSPYPPDEGLRRDFFLSLLGGRGTDDITGLLGERRLNFNTAPRAELEERLSFLRPSVISGIIEQRRERPFGRVGELARVDGVTDVMLRRMREIGSVESSRFLVLLSLKAQGDTRNALVILNREGASIRRDALVSLPAFEEESYFER